MGILTKLFSSPVETVVEKVGNALDSLVTSDHERLQMQNELEKIKLQARLEADKMQLEADRVIEEEVSKRWQADSNSDEPLAKKVRPLSLIYLMLVVTIMAFADGNLLSFDIKSAYIDLFQALLMLVFGAYYGSRGLEKIYAIKNK
jgi:cation transport ATPase